MDDNKSGSAPRHALLTDIQGSEDHWGDMDFKVPRRDDTNALCVLKLEVVWLRSETAVRAFLRFFSGFSPGRRLRGLGRGSPRCSST